jgi:hypothetical protein|tara:strand:+ start:43983 stop:44201 length:219 start_codon:yes stop_codon:yes gene_type:complete
MIVKFKLAGFFVDKPKYATIEIDAEADAVQLADGNILKVKQLDGPALDQYVFEKYVANTGMDGRVLEMVISS